NSYFPGRRCRRENLAKSESPRWLRRTLNMYWIASTWRYFHLLISLIPAPSMVKLCNYQRGNSIGNFSAQNILSSDDICFPLDSFSLRTHRAHPNLPLYFGIFTELVLS